MAKRTSVADAVDAARVATMRYFSLGGRFRVCDHSIDVSDAVNSTRVAAIDFDKFSREYFRYRHFTVAISPMRTFTPIVVTPPNVRILLPKP